MTCTYPQVECVYHRELCAGCQNMVEMIRVRGLLEEETVEAVKGMVGGMKGKGEGKEGEGVEGK